MAVDDKKKYAYNYLIGKGLSPIAAAGIVGNLVAESGLNTTIPGKADNKGSIGIAQWHSDRKEGLMNFAKRANQPFSKLSTQLDYLVYELNSPGYSKALSGLNSARTPGEASIAFMNHYEKPAEWAKKQSVGKRVNEAASVYTGKPYTEVAYTEEEGSSSYYDPNQDFNYDKNPQGSTYVAEEEEDFEAETAKQELAQKQVEKNFLAELQSQISTQPQVQQDVQQAYEIDPSLYQMPQIALPEYGDTNIPTMQIGGIAGEDQKILIKDNRKISATTGKPINPNSDIVTGKYDKKVIRNLALAASKYNADPYTNIAVGLQESKLGTTDGNIGHIIGKHDTKFTGREEEDLVSILQDKLRYAKRLGIEDEATMLQAYNGLGKITPQTEKGYHGFEMAKIYGVPLPKEGIDMRKNPLYGKRVIDLRDNVIKKNPELVRYVESLPKYNPFSGEYEDKNNPLPMLNYRSKKRFQEGGQTDPVKQWTLDYINSPKYRERLKGSGYEDVNGEIKARAEDVKNTKISYSRPTALEALKSFRLPVYPSSHFDDDIVNLDYKSDLKYLKKAYPELPMPTKNEILAHEMSHAETEYGGRDNRMNDYDTRNLKGRGMNIPWVNSHDKEPDENKSDLNAFRYLLKQQGIYDAGKEDFTKEHLKKAKNTFTKGRLKRNYSDKSLIWLMNHVAQTDKQNDNIQYVKDGGTIKPRFTK